MNRAITTFALVSCIAIATATPVLSRAADSNLRGLDGLLIVEAHVTNVRHDRDRTSLCTLTITGVVCGPQKLVGQTFDIYSGDGPHNGEQIGPPALNVGEEGIWPVLRRQQNGLECNLSTPVAGYLPARRARTERYEQAKAFAVAVSKVIDAAPAARIELVEHLVLDATPEVSSWAVGLIESIADDKDEKNEGERRAMLQLLHELSASDKVPVAGVAALDAALIEVDRAIWAHSEKRIQMLRSAAGREMDLYDMKRFASRLISNPDLAWANLDDVAALDILGIALRYSSSRKGEPSRAELLHVDQNGLFESNPLTGRDSSKVFEFLVAQIKDASNADIRIEAASVLPTPINADQSSSIEALIKESHDPILIGILKRIIETGKSQDKK